jgi:dihydroxyacid dehydratase/phosphogluconate dehydratase
MEEIAQITTALKYLDYGKQVAVLTDARFSGFSTGACLGHISPEALAGGPIGKLVDGDLIEITVDRENLKGSVNLVGAAGREFGAAEGVHLLEHRPLRPDLAPEEHLPDATRLWAALQNVGGGTWGGCVYDVDAIIQALKAGQQALAAGAGR